ncbi:hypothetical protein HBB16_13925 [Pseudonocardia sp. MCCB 268]|nr:hypothetical protein [Pseudonocardia cytotoxica]
MISTKPPQSAERGYRRATVKNENRRPGIWSPIRSTPWPRRCCSRRSSWRSSWRRSATTILRIDRPRLPREAARFWTIFTAATVMLARRGGRPSPAHGTGSGPRGDESRAGRRRPGSPWSSTPPSRPALVTPVWSR